MLNLFMKIQHDFSFYINFPAECLYNFAKKDIISIEIHYSN